MVAPRNLNLIFQGVNQTGSNSPVTLAILAGGKSTRMGRPKTTLRIGGQPMLAYLLRQLHWDGPTLLVTTPGQEKPDSAHLFDREVVDPIEGEGPLRGVLTSLQNCSTEIACVLTTDMPLVSEKHLTVLVRTLQTDQSLLAVMTSRSDGDKERIEPFPLAIRRSAELMIAPHLSSGKRSVHSLSTLPHIAVLKPGWHADVWTNLNTPTEVEFFLKSQEPPP